MKLLQGLRINTPIGMAKVHEVDESYGEVFVEDDKGEIHHFDFDTIAECNGLREGAGDLSGDDTSQAGVSSATYGQREIH